MHAYVLVFPMFAMVLLTAVVLARLFRSRVRAVREGQLPASYFRIYQGATEPENTAKPARHFTNLFEAPTLFYVACLAAMVTGATGTAMQLLAWLYVAARLIHSYVHLGANRLGLRIRAYFGSWLILMGMWVYLAVHAVAAAIESGPGL
jgi:hypothetical protein